MKILIVSHNCFSNTQNMGKTFCSLFSNFNKDELMQLYLYPSLPTVDCCESYFRITDSDAIHSILNRKKCGSTQKVVKEEINGLYEDKKTEKKYNAIGSDNYIIRRARDIMWKFGNWKSNDLINWIKKNKPNAVFLALGDAVFSQNIAVWISKHFEIPLITYVCDEYYFTLKKKSFIDKSINSILIRKIKKTIKSSTRIITICDSLGKKYENEFKIPYTVIMTGSSLETSNTTSNTKNNQISFIGNTSLNRYKSLVDISQALKEINLEKKSDYKLVYYGRENEELKEKIVYGGYLTPSEMKDVMMNSLFLLHTETFDIDYRDRLMYSVSTKIADSLASGTCLIAYGPSEIASMQHLINNKCALCITSKNELKKKILDLINDKKLMETYKKNAIDTASKFHNSSKNSKLLHDTLNKIVNDISLK